MEQTTRPPAMDAGNQRRPARPRSPHLAALADPARMPDEYDALADLFLDEAPRARDAGATASSAEPAGRAARPRSSDVIARLGMDQPATRAAPLIEGIALGHLPVTGAAWANQYARHIAETTGEPVAVLKLVAGQVSVELFGADAAEALDQAPANLQEAVALAAGRARRWLVRVDEPSEPMLLEPGRLDALTLLTGVDEAAVVASYQTLKGLMERVRGFDGEPDGPRFGLALMGATAERAEARSAKIVRAAEMFLGRRISVEACVARIGPGRATTVYRGTLDEDQAERALADLREWARPSTRRTARPEASTDAAAVLSAIDAASRAASAATPATERRGAEPGPSPAEVASDAGPVRAEGPSLAALLGLTPLRAACPYAAPVELAVGPEGGLHVVAAAGAARRAGWCASVAEAVEQLMVASSWAMDHVALLRMAEPAAAGAAGTHRPVMHLVTDDARPVRRLLDGEMRLHVMVQVGDRQACSPLN